MKDGVIGFGCVGYNGALSIRTFDHDATIRVFNQTGEAPGNQMKISYYAEKRIDDVGIYPTVSLEDIKDRLNLISVFNGSLEALSIRQKCQIIAARFSNDFVDFLGGKG